jgi:uncharacterized membrane protein SpoIIM required for sporulation
VILDLPRFLATERPYWDELHALLDRMEQDRLERLTLPQITRFEYLYGRAASALARISTFSADPETRAYLEALVARAYLESQVNHAAKTSFRPLIWLRRTFPQTFRRHLHAFQLAVALTIAGMVFGGAAVAFDPDSKPVLMPFAGLAQSPRERVKQEESVHTDRLASHKATFSAQLMTHNIAVSLRVFAMGASWGIGSTIILFFNGVTLGAVAADYIHAGYTRFLLGWLLPHGVIEIPAILIAGQAAFVLAAALMGWSDALGRRRRLHLVLPEILTLVSGVALMLVWAGIVEAFVSQYHYPVLPYGLKIAFGLVELSALSFYLLRIGRS